MEVKDNSQNNSLDWNVKGAIAMELGNLIARYNRHSVNGRQGTFEAYKSLKQIRLLLSAYIESNILDKYHTMEDIGDAYFRACDEVNAIVNINAGFTSYYQYLNSEKGKKYKKIIDEYKNKFDLNVYAENIMLLLKDLGFSFGVKSDASQMKM